MTSALAPAPATAGSDLADAVRRGLLVGAAVLTVLIPSAVALHGAGEAARGSVRLADFGEETPSPDARQVADWVADSRDNASAGFVIVDKRFARVYVFDADARLRGSSPVLLGAAPGDDSVPGIGARQLAEVRPEERTTPAGRFVAERGHNALGEDVVWVDYEAAVSMHRVRTTEPKERRLERLATPTIDDNRISYGCINVPVAFYDDYIHPMFAMRRAIVYVLPEIKSAQQVFGAYDVGAAKKAGAFFRLAKTNPSDQSVRRQNERAAHSVR